MFPNGYIMVDCGGLELNSSSTQEISDLYERSAAALATGKPVYAVNCKMNGGYCSPVAVAAWQEDAHTIIATGHVFRVTIEDDDDVTVTNLVAG
jgi:hypothetical protein